MLQRIRKDLLTYAPPISDQSVIWVVATVGLALSLAALLLIHEQLETHRNQEFEWVAHNRIRAMSHDLDNGLLAVASLQDFLFSTQRIDPRDFEAFASSLLARHHGIQALMWAPRVTEEERADFEAAQSSRRPGFAILEKQPHFAVTQAAPRREYFPLTYIVPREGNQPSYGFDLESLPETRSVLRRAEETGDMAASGRIAFPNGHDGVEFGFLVALPVLGGESAGQDAGTLRGFAVGLFRLTDMVMSSVALLEPRGVEILVLDESAPEDEQFLHFYSSRLTPSKSPPAQADSLWVDPDEPKLAEQIRVADRVWRIVCGRTDQFRSAEAFQQGPWVAMVTGLLFTALLSFYLFRIREDNQQRMLLEQRLVEREQLFRQMTETVDEVFWACDTRSGELIYRSPTFRRILEGPERSGMSLLDGVPSDDRPQIEDALSRVTRGGGDFEVVHRVVRRDGTQRWMRTRGFSVGDERGYPYRIVGFSEDITERKLADEALRESEAKLRDLFVHSPDVIMTVDRRGKILLMNRSIPALPADRAVGHSSLALMPTELRKWFRRALKKVFKKGATPQFEYTTDDGIYWEGRIVPIGREGEVTAAMVIASDVTEKRHLEAQALRNARLASIGVLAAGVAHEINNPNNAIQFNASLVGRAWQDATPILAEYYEEHGDFALAGLDFSEARNSLPTLLTEIIRNSERIRRIVENLKHMSRQDAGELSARVDIQQVLEATVMILHNQIQKHTDICVLRVPDGLPPIPGNSQQLEQVFINLLFNALQALPTRQHGVYICAALDPESGQVMIGVRDEGRGIDERDLGRLTEPFFTTRPDAGGTGLGLSISRSIVERHGGGLAFDSRPGAGTTVTIRLPALLDFAGEHT